MLTRRPSDDAGPPPSATVIVRTKNSQDTLAQALDGLFSQTWKDFDPAQLRKQTQRFGRDRFARQIANAVQYGYRQWRVDPGPESSGPVDIPEDEEIPSTAAVQEASS